jgi:hypothetical protein
MARNRNFDLNFSGILNLELNPLMRERIKVASWVDFHFLRLDWPAEYPAMLRERHFEPAKRQMDRERGLAVSLSTVDDIKDLPVWLDAKEGSRRDLGYYFSNLEGVLENRYSVLSGFPLSWVVRDRLCTPEWSDLTSLQAVQQGVKPDFFDFAHVDDICRRMALIVPCPDNASTKSEDKSVQDRYETGAKAECRTKVEGLHYGPTCWKLMTTAQQAEAVKLRKQKLTTKGD